jgi:hypothetical protein
VLARTASLAGLPATLRASARARADAAVRRCAPADPRAALKVFALSFALVVAVALAFPAAAQADPISDAIRDAIQSVLGWVFERVMSGLFGRIQGEITQALAAWLVAIPNFDPSAQQEYVAGPAKSNIDAARQATSMLALGGLGAVMTLSVVRYWLSGLSMRGSGGIEAFEGFSRTLLAVGMILLWPDAFRLFVALTNSATHALLNWPEVKDAVSGLWGWTTALTAGSFALSAPVAVIITIIVFVAFALLLLGLVLMKIMITAGTAVIYVLMPVALVLWPLPETAWVARVVGRAFVVCLLIPLTWAVIFITFAALGADFFTLRGQGGVLERVIVTPLVAIAMLGLSITVPKALGKSALLGAVNSTGGSAGVGAAGFFGRMASSVAARRADSVLAQRVPASWGGRAQPAPSSMSPAAEAGLAAAGVPLAGGEGGSAGADPSRGAGSGAGAPGGGAPGGGTPGGGPNPQAGDGRQPHDGSRPDDERQDERQRQGQGPQGQGQPSGQPAPTRRHSGDIPFHNDPKALKQVRDDARAWNANNGGPNEIATWGALTELSMDHQDRVAAEARSLSSRDFQDAMLTRATNPAFSSAEQGAWFTLGAAGRDRVRQIVAFEEDGGFTTPPMGTGGGGGDIGGGGGDGDAAPPPASPAPGAGS